MFHYVRVTSTSLSSTTYFPLKNRGGWYSLVTIVGAHVVRTDFSLRTLPVSPWFTTVWAQNMLFLDVFRPSIRSTTLSFKNRSNWTVTGCPSTDTPSLSLPFVLRLPDLVLPPVRA